MANLLEQLLSLAAAGTMMVSSALYDAAPQNDIDGLLFLQNRQWRAARAFIPEVRVTDMKGKVRELREDASIALEKMAADCHEQTGEYLVSVSGYRSYQTQSSIYQRKKEKVGTKKADEYVARAGASEHQLGLAMDLGWADYEGCSEKFPRSKAGKWTHENCWKYGFILRYQAGWEDITGYKQEEWHFRYVGLEHAKAIYGHRAGGCGRMMKRLIALMALLAMLLPAAAEEEDDWLFVDLSGDMVVSYNAVKWDFPVDIADMEPDLIYMVNKSMFLDEDFTPKNLVKMKTLANGGVRQVDGTWQLREECAEALVELCDAARAEGHELYLKSGYRSYYKQAVMYENRVKKYGYDDGWVTKPGASDHQTGLGCDVVPKKWTDRGMNEDMAKEPETQWMAENCARFGFILRYPEDKEDITEINYEPWHLRYVGVPVATYIMDNGLCLEEFYDQLMTAIDGFIAAGGDESLVEDFIQTSAKDQYSRY